MRHHRSQLLFLFGAWLSFVGIVVAAGVLVPTTKNLRALSPAAAYRAITTEELRAGDTIPLSGKVIAINETQMELSLYENGANTRTFKIEQLAAPFSLSEVPNGSYAVNKKEPQHFSQTNGTWMPSVVQLSDNLSIHGPPRMLSGDEKGDSVEVSVQLAALDAKDVYDFADIGGKVIVSGGYSRSLFTQSPRYYLSGDGKLPDISAPEFLIADIESGDVLWERSAHTKREFGRLASFATALTAIETLDQYKNVRIGQLLLNTKSARRSPPSHDDELPLGSLMYPLLFDANETAAKALEKSLGSEDFADYMNVRATELGMGDTQFGLSANVSSATTTAADLFKLFSYIYREEHFLLDVSRASDHELFLPSGALRYHWENKNPWVLRKEADYQGGLGVLGTSGEGSGMFVFNLPLTEFEDRPIAFIIVDSTDLEGDIARMKEFITLHYRYGAKRDEATALAAPEKTLLQRFRAYFEKEIIYDRGL